MLVVFKIIIPHECHFGEFSYGPENQKQYSITTFRTTKNKLNLSEPFQDFLIV